MRNTQKREKEEALEELLSMVQVNIEGKTYWFTRNQWLKLEKKIKQCQKLNS